MTDEDDADARVEGGGGGAEGDLCVDDGLEEPVAQAGDCRGELAARGVGGVDCCCDCCGGEGVGEEGGEVGGEGGEGVIVALRGRRLLVCERGGRGG